jgi:hypothetical protein
MFLYVFESMVLAGVLLFWILYVRVLFNLGMVFLVILFIIFEKLTIYPHSFDPLIHISIIKQTTLHLYILPPILS